jgi:hypothetical protein
VGVYLVLVSSTPQHCDYSWPQADSSSSPTSARHEEIQAEDTKVRWTGVAQLAYGVPQPGDSQPHQPIDRRDKTPPPSGVVQAQPSPFPADSSRPALPAKPQPIIPTPQMPSYSTLPSPVPLAQLPPLASRPSGSSDVRRPQAPVKQFSQPNILSTSGQLPPSSLGQIPDIPLPMPRRYTLEPQTMPAPPRTSPRSNVPMSASDSSLNGSTSAPHSPSFMLRKVVSLRNLRKGAGKAKLRKGDSGEIPNKLPRGMVAEINKFQLEGYAKKFFAAQKRGIFRRRIPVTELLTFQKVDKTLPSLSHNVGLMLV